MNHYIEGVKKVSRRYHRHPKYRIDWPEIAIDIRRKVPLRDAAKHLNVSKDYLSKLSRCEINEPTLSLGLEILEYHASLFLANE